MPVSGHSLLLFSAAALGLLVSPGPNMVFVLSHGLSHGVRGGVAAAAGIFGADVILSLLTAGGVAALLAAWPASFTLLRIGGALYLLWLAWQALSRHGAFDPQQAPERTLGRIFRMSATTSLLNPKALLFFLVFLPQFVDPRRGEPGLQLLWLGGVLALLALLFHTALGAFSGRLARVFSASAAATAALARVPAIVYVFLAARLLAAT